MLAPTLLTQISTTYLLFAAFVLAAAMTSLALKDDPRFLGVDWAATHEKLLAYIERNCGPLDPDDVAQAVITKAFRTDIVQWDPGAKSIFVYLGSLANTEMSNRLTSRYYKKERGELSDVVQAITSSPGADAESKLTSSAAERRYDRILTALRNRLAGAKLPLFLLEVHESGPSSHHESTDRALAEGYTMDDITAARQKIHRAINKLLTEDEQDERSELLAAAR